MPPPPPDKRRALYDLLMQGKYKKDLPDYDTFSKNMEDEKIASEFHDTLSGDDDYRNSLPTKSDFLDAVSKKKVLPSFQEQIGLSKPVDPLLEHMQGGAPSGLPPSPTTSTPVDQPNINAPVGDLGIQIPPQDKQFNPEQINFDAQKEAQDEARLKQNLIEGPIEKKESNPFITAGKTIYSTLKNQVGPDILQGLSAMVPSQPMGYGTSGVPISKKDRDQYSESIKSARAAMVDWNNELKGEGAELTKDLVKTMDDVHDPIDALNYAIQAVSQTGAQIGPAILSFGTSSVAQEIGSIYLESVNKIAEEKRITPQEVIMSGQDQPAIAIGAGMAAGALEYIGANKIAKAFKLGDMARGLRSRALVALKKGGKAGATELGTEWTQTGIEQFGKELSTPGVSPGQAFENVFSKPEYRKERQEASTQAFIGGSALAGGGSLMSKENQPIAPTGDLGNGQQPTAQPGPVSPNPTVDNQGQPAAPQQAGGTGVAIEPIPAVSSTQGSSEPINSPVTTPLTTTKNVNPKPEKTAKGGPKTKVRPPAKSNGGTKSKPSTSKNVAKEKVVANDKGAKSPVTDQKLEQESPTFTDQKERVIAENMNGIHPEDFGRWGDKKHVSNVMRLNYFRRKATRIDQQAQDMSYILNPEGDGNDITPQDIVDFVIKHQKLNAKNRFSKMSKDDNIQFQNPQEDAPEVEYHERNVPDIEEIHKVIDDGDYADAPDLTDEQLDFYLKDEEITPEKLEQAKKDGLFSGFPYNEEDYGALKKHFNDKLKEGKTEKSGVDVPQEIVGNSQTEPAKDSAKDQKVEQGKQKIAKGLEALAAKIGAIKNVNPLDDSSAWEDVKSIIDGLGDIGISKAKDVVAYLKKELAKYGITGEHIDEKLDDIIDHLKPAMSPTSMSETSEGFERKPKKKSLLNRAHQGTEDADVEKAIEKHGLNYEPETFIHAKENASAFIEEVGFEDALDAVRANKIDDGAAAFVWSDLIDQVGDRIAESKDDAERQELVDMEADLISEFDTKARSGGRFISALQDVYANSDFGYKLSSQVAKYKERNDGTIPAEVEAKFKELDAQLTEVKKKRAEAEERAEKAEAELAIANIKAAAAKEKSKKVVDVRIKAARDERSKLKREFFAQFNPAKSGGRLNAAVPGATLVVYGVKIANTYVKEGLVRAEDIINKTREYFDKELGYKMSDEEAESIKKALAKKMESAKEKAGKLRVPHDMIRELVESGVDNIDDLVRDVKALLKDTHPNATDRQIRDAITGYGKVANPSQDEIEKQIRKLTRVGRIASAMEDVANKKKPLRSGVQRDKLDAEERKLARDLREAMKELPPDEETDAKQLKNSLDAIKTRLKNHIEDLEREIETGKQSAKAKGVEYDAEAKALAAERDQVKEIHDSIFGKHMDEEAKIASVLRNTNRAIEETIRKIEAGELEAKKSTKPTSPAVKEAQQRLRNLKERLNQLREEAGIPERKRLENAKKRANDKIKDLTERLKTGNFEKAPKRPALIKDSELNNLDAEIARIKEQYDKEQYKNELKNRTLRQKLMDGLIEIWGLTRAIRATAEFSFVLIQNWMYTLSHPLTAAKAVGTAFSHFASPQRSEDFLNHIRAQEYFGRAKASKLAISETDVKLTAREEMFIGSWGNHLWDFLGYPLKAFPKAYEAWKNINPLKAFERAGTGFLNTVRLTRFLQGEEMLRMQGYTFGENPEEWKNMADVINTFTGRASLGPAERISKELAIVFFSPRNWASIIKQMTPYAFVHFGRMVTKEGKVSVAQKMAMLDYMKAVGGTTAFMMLLDWDDELKKKWGITIEMDPRSSDFMKIKIGDTRIDPWGGRQQMIVFQARLIMNSIKDGKGKVKKLGEGRNPTTAISMLATMAKNKLAPSTALAFKLADRKVKKIGKKEVWVDDYGNELFEDPEKNLYPIYYESIQEIYQQQPAAFASFITFMGFWGLGSQTYNSGDMRKKRREFIQKVKNEK